MDELVRESFPLDLSGRVEMTAAGPILHGALICGDESEWGYPYPRSLWTDATLLTYEGLPSFTGHNTTGEQPDPDKKLGWWTNVRRRPNDGRPEGDYHLNPKHTLCESVVWAAEHNPSFYAFSHQAYLRKETVAGKLTVTGIVKPVSVDLVVRGATTGGIFEHAPIGVRKVTTAKVYLTALAPKLDLKQLVKARTMLTLAKEGYDDAPMAATAPDPAAPATTADQGMDATTVSLCVKECQSVVDAKSDPAAVKKCLGRLKKIFGLHCDLSNDDIDAAPDEDGKKPDAKPPEKAAESAPVVKPVAVVATIDAGELLTTFAAEGWTPTTSQLDAAKTFTDPKKLIAFVREQKGLALASKPKGSGRDTGLTKESAPTGPSSDQEAMRLKMAALARENQGIPATAAK
jgi:hypothetical protein